MQKRTLGNSDLSITAIGHGAWAIGGSGWEFGWGPQNDEESIAAIKRSLELGVNWIDTAAVYGLGHSEEVVGQALSEWKGNRPYVFTKCGRRLNKQGKLHTTLKAGSIRQECEDSLRRLRIEVIDLYQIHWPPDDNVPELEEGWATLASLKREGKIRWIGVSNFTIEQMKRVQSIAPITSLQPPYSLIRRGVEEDIFPYCKKEKIGVLVYAPMASGLLTGAMTRERAANLPPDDWRRKNPEFNEPKLSGHLNLVESLREVGKRHGRSAGEVAIAWTLRNPVVTGAIVGARSSAQVEGVMRAAELKLSVDDLSTIEGIEKRVK